METCDDDFVAAAKDWIKRQHDHDKHVGELLDLLDELGIANDTFVLYSTDNGPHMNTWPDGAMTPFRSGRRGQLGTRGKSSGWSSEVRECRKREEEAMLRPMSAAIWARSATMLGLAALVLAAPAMAQYVYPGRGQSPQQQQQDQGECHTWAVQQTGVNPGTTPAPATAGAGAHGAVRGAAGGAAVGAIGGAIGGDAGKGAAIGAATGAVIGGVRSRRQARAAESSYAGAQQNYQQALYACLEGRGYTIR
jgi:Sulfatase/Glycine-zipper domain